MAGEKRIIVTQIHSKTRQNAHTPNSVKEPPKVYKQINKDKSKQTKTKQRQQTKQRQNERQVTERTQPKEEPVASNE
jgi:hypothetical protein